MCNDDPRIVQSEDDCRDTDASVFPGNPACERGADNDCLGGVDHPCADVCGDGWCSPTELAAGGPDCLEELPVELVDDCGFRLDTCATGADLTTSPAGPDVYVRRGECVTLAGYDQVHQTCVDVLTPDGAQALAWTICFPALDDPDPCAGDPACAAVDGCGPVYTLREVCP